MNKTGSLADTEDMDKQINFLGSSIWVPAADPEQTTHGDNTPISLASPLTRAFYSPLALAAYCVFTNVFIGTLLYGINLARRGYGLKGKVLVALSSLILLVSTFSPNLDPFVSHGSRTLINGLVALSLFAAEYTHFQRAKRQGRPSARWWLPLIWLVLASGLRWLIVIIPAL